MEKSIYNAARSMNAKMRNIQLVANNLANINTTGFKREIPFSEYMSREGNAALKQITDFSEGAFVETGNKLDLAISGNGFFVINTGKGEELTKNGQFEINEEGYLINKDGHRVLGKNGEINLLESMLSKENDIIISSNGEIKIGETILDQLKIGRIDSQAGMMRSEGQSYFFPNSSVNDGIEEQYSIHQGYVEESNTNPILEMQSMIKLEKDFQAAQKMITSMDDIMSKSREIGKV